jgi:hypothetical protein
VSVARTPGRQTDEPDDDAPILQVDELDYDDVGRTLQELATQLRGIADLIDNGDLRRFIAQVNEIGDSAMHEEADRMMAERFERTLPGLRSFRRNYD